MTETVRMLNVRCTGRLHRGLQYVALRDGRSMTEIAVSLLEQHVLAWIDPATGEGVPAHILAGPADEVAL